MNARAEEPLRGQCYGYWTLLNPSRIKGLAEGHVNQSCSGGDRQAT